VARAENSVPDSNNCIQESLHRRGRIGWQKYFTFSPNCTHSGFLAVSSQWRKLQASNLVQLLIKSVLTRKLKFILKRTWRESRDLHLNFHIPLMCSKPLMPDTLNLVNTLTITCPNRKSYWYSCGYGLQRNCATLHII